MSFNQSRPDKNEDPQFKKSGRLQSKPGAAGRCPPPIFSNHSFKQSNDARESRAGVSSVNSTISITSRGRQNGSHVQPQLNGTASNPIKLSGSQSGIVKKNATSQTTSKISDALSESKSGMAQKNATSKPTSKTSDTNASTPFKDWGEQHKTFPLQFGSISPGFQIPRTSSAPPNLDEQKFEQSQCHLFNVPSGSVLPVPKQPLQKNDDSVCDQPSVGKSNPEPEAKREMQVSSESSLNQIQKPALLSMVGISTPMAMHQSQVSVPFGGFSPQMQPHGSTTDAEQIPVSMPLLVGGSPQVQQKIFVPALQTHVLQRSMGITPTVDSQLGSSGFNVASQYRQQQEENFGGPHKPVVRIIDPKTHGELVFDNKQRYASTDIGSSSPRYSSIVPLQSLPIISETPHSINNFSKDSCSSSSSFPPKHGSLPAPLDHIASNSHGQKSSSLISQGATNISFISPTASISLPDSKSMSPVHHIANSPNVKEVQVHDVISASSAAKHATIQPPPGSLMQVIDSFPKEKSLSRPNSIKADNKVSGKKGLIQGPHQVGFHMSQDHTSYPYGEVSATVQPSESNAAKRGGTSTSNEVSSAEFSVEISDPISYPKLESSLQIEQSKHELDGTKKVGVRRLPGSVDDIDDSDFVTESPLKKSNSTEQSKPPSCMKSTAINNGISDSESLEELDEHVSFHAEVDSVEDNNVLCNSITHGYKTSLIIASSCRSNSNNDTEVGRTDLQFAPVQTSELAEMKHEGDRIEHAGFQRDPIFISFVKDKRVMDMNKMRNMSARGKKKRKEILQKADAAGTTSDLYMAYKEPEVKKETVMSAESYNESLNMKHVSAGFLKEEEAVLTKKDVQGKLELDDWEDAVDISTVQLKYEGFEDKAKGRVALHHDDGSGDMAKKYSRDFLLKFAKQFINLPNGFEITPNLQALMSINRVNSNSYANLGKMDRPSGASRPTQGAISGALKNPRAQAGPMPSIGSQGKIQRNGSNTDRWQRGANFQLKSLISPPTPLQMMHRAEKKYEVGKVADEEETKQRQLKAILNKLTPQNFEKLFEQVKAVNIDSGKTLCGVIYQIFDKALMEPTFCEMYANFCLQLAGELPDFSKDNQKITFKRLLLNKCQEEFEREQEENDEVNEVSEMKQSEEEREAKRIKARRRMLGNIRLIGELYKKKMLTEKVMHVCIKKLLGHYQNPDEEDIEALCKLMSTIGEMIDHPKAKDHMNAYFEMMTELSNNTKLSSRVRFMLKDAIDLRKNKWHQRRKVEGPKKIDEVHRDAVQERQAQASRLGRGPGINESLRRGTSMDFGFRAPTLLPSPNAQAGGFHGLSTQVCGSSSQNTCFEGKQQSCEARAFPSPLPQRSICDDTITFGPQASLARGMSIRGPQSISAASLADMSLPTGNNFQRMTAVLSPHGSVSEHAIFKSRGDITPRNMSKRFAGSVPLDQASTKEPGITHGNRQLGNIDSSLGRSQSMPPTKHEQPALTPNGHSEVASEERLQDKSIAAIREYYSARDEKEVTLCIKDLNSPSFHASMISLWVIDSFERENTERDLLAKLLVSLTKSDDGTLTQVQLVKGIELVLATLEDAVNDAPKAPEFMGRLLANLIWENLISLKEVGKLIHEGGEEPGCLLRFGLAADVLGNLLEVVRLEKGEVFLNEILRSSNLQLERFRPPNPIKSIKLEKFI